MKSSARRSELSPFPFLRRSGFIITRKRAAPGFEAARSGCGIHVLLKTKAANYRLQLVRANQKASSREAVTSAYRLGRLSEGSQGTTTTYRNRVAHIYECANSLA